MTRHFSKKISITPSRQKYIYIKKSFAKNMNQLKFLFRGVISAEIYLYIKKVKAVSIAKQSDDRAKEREKWPPVYITHMASLTNVRPESRPAVLT
jgi:hypothetical protein